MSNSSGPKFIIRGRKTYRNSQKMEKQPSDANFSEEESETEDSPKSKQQKEQQQPLYENTSRDEQIDTSDNSGSKFNLKTWFTAVIIVLCGGICATNYSGPEPISSTIDALKLSFPNQPSETFDDFETILNEIVFEKAIHPAVFLLLYETNENKVNKLVDHLANFASEKLHSKSYINVPKEEFHTDEARNDYGYLIDKYKSDLINKKVMVVKNLQNIPAQTAQVFHSFCDEISPLVERVVFIFTLKVDSLDGREEKIAENNLKRVWKELDTDILMPLITRVTSTVLKIMLN